MASGPPWGLPAGQGDVEETWRALGSQFPPLVHFPCAYPALPCCGLLPTAPLGLLAQPVSAPCELAGPALYWPPVPPSGPGVEEAWRAKAAASSPASASRESTAALKAWLGRHRRNPYPTKGEKVLLALVSRMSLTQVSTWFANARRRLKKERRAPASPDGAHRAHSPAPASPAPRTPDPTPEEQPREDAAPAAKKIWCLAELATGAPTPDGSRAAALQH